MWRSIQSLLEFYIVHIDDDNDDDGVDEFDEDDTDISSDDKGVTRCIS